MNNIELILIALAWVLFIILQPYAIEGRRYVSNKWLLIAIRVYFFAGWLFVAWVFIGIYT